MSNLWAAMLASDDGYYPFEVSGEEIRVSVLQERRFDRLARLGSFGLVARNEGGLCESGVCWTTLKGGRMIENVRRFFLPPTVVYTKGAKGLAIWAVHPTSRTWTLNDGLARLFKGRIKDSDPDVFRVDLRGFRSEWSYGLYDADELMVRL